MSRVAILSATVFLLAACSGSTSQPPTGYVHPQFFDQSQRLAFVYDDLNRWPYCPHEEFLSETEAARKDAAFSLLGRKVVFRHDPNGKRHRVLFVGYTGMVTIQGMTGEFAPHLFEIAL